MATATSHKTKDSGKASKKRKRRNSKKAHQPGITRPTAADRVLAFLEGVKEDVLARETLPFDVGRFAHMPYNVNTGHAYGGKYNRPILLTQAALKGWTDPRFLTIGYAKELGADFRGQRTTELCGWQPHYTEDEETGEKLENGGHFYWFKVLNAQQLANLDELPIPAVKQAAWPDETSAQVVDAVRNHILKNFNKHPEFKEDAMVESPHYLPHRHVIVLPPISQYKSLDLFMLSLVHELMHATGGDSELKRYDSKTAENFHSERERYAFEEMVAQFATSFLLMHYGFQYEVKRSAKYIQGWFRAVREKPETLDEALKVANNIIGHILKDNPLPDLLEQGRHDEAAGKDDEGDAVEEMVDWQLAEGQLELIAA